VRTETGKTYKTEGIVLKRVNFGEADRIITFFTKHFGKTVCLAKGIRRTTSRKRGDLEIFNRVTFFAARGRGMDIVTETELICSYSSWRRDLKKIAAAYQICEMVDKLTAEGHEQEDVYGLLTASLLKLDLLEKSVLASFVSDFSLSLLMLLGFWPKEKPVPRDFDTNGFIEELIERELKSKRFFRNT